MSAGSCVVVIDDEWDVLSMVQDVLEDEGYSVVGIAHPRDLERALDDVHPDIFLVDVMLPGTSGIEVAQHLRAHGYSATPMVAMSASKLMTHYAFDSGVFQEAIEKPFDIVALLDTVERRTSQHSSL